MTDLADLAAVIRSGQVSHRDAQDIVDNTPDLKEYMAKTSVLTHVRSPEKKWTRVP